MHICWHLLDFMEKWFVYGLCITFSTQCNIVSISDNCDDNINFLYITIGFSYAKAYSGKLHVAYVIDGKAVFVLWVILVVPLYSCIYLLSPFWKCSLSQNNLVSMATITKHLLWNITQPGIHPLWIYCTDKCWYSTYLQNVFWEICSN